MDLQTRKILAPWVFLKLKMIDKWVGNEHEYFIK